LPYCLNIICQSISGRLPQTIYNPKLNVVRVSANL
jgi:hypothetical protein